MESEDLRTLEMSFVSLKQIPSNHRVYSMLLRESNNSAALLFLSSVEFHADTSTGLLDQHLFYESEQGWLSSSRLSAASETLT